MALRYKDSKYLDYSGALLVPGRIPLDIRSVVADISNLLSEDTWHKDGDITSSYEIAYKGMIVTVEATDEAYMCIDPNNVSSLSAWKKVGSGSNIVINSSFIHIDKTDPENSSIYLDVSKSTSDSSWPNTGLATNGYVDELLSWVIIPGN